MLGMEKLYLALDAGVTNIHLGLGDATGIIDETRRKVETDDYWSEEGLRNLVQEVTEEYGTSVEDLERIGIGVSGLVDPEDKELVYSYSLEELEFHELKNLETEFIVENDANVAVLGEKHYGVGTEVDNLAIIIIGSGVGGGIYYRGELLGSQRDGSSPEPAGIAVSRDLTWEEAVGGKNMPGYIAELLEDEERSTNLSKEMNAEQIFEAAETDAVAKEYLKKLSDFNSKGIATLVDMYAPDIITFTGSLAAENPDFMKESFEQVEEHSINTVPEMKISELGNELGLYGALALAQGKHESN
jgi:glucokinase